MKTLSYESNNHHFISCAIFWIQNIGAAKMIKIMNKLFSLLFLLLLSTTLFAQPYRFPVTIPVALSGNFGELRTNSFHAGLDFRTQQTVNKPIVAIADGYISRIYISPSGFGLALFVNHPETGHTSVYAHLNSFARPIAEYARARQYELERFRIDVRVESGRFPVRKGEQIALSGNTGSSTGPHLHFEIRDTETQDPLDPMEFLGHIRDTTPPELQGIAFFPQRGQGVINGSQEPVRLAVRRNQAGNPLPLTETINAWGRIGVGVRAVDRMDGQAGFIFGIKHIRLFVDDELVFSSSMHRFPLAKRRMLNSFIDFDHWRNTGERFMRSFIEPGNQLPFFQNTQGDGFIDINEERIFNLRYELEDHNGNTRTFRFAINGQPQEIEYQEWCVNFMSWRFANSFIDFNNGFSLNIPQGNLYNSFCFSHTATSNPNFFSDVHQVNDSFVPLHNEATMWIQLTDNVPENRTNLGIVRLAVNGARTWIGGRYSNGGIETAIRELGNQYAVTIDNTPPVITPLEPNTWAGRRRIRIRLTDDLSGIASFRGEINGQFVLFTHDMKSPVFTYYFDDTRLPPRGEAKVLTFTAVDNAGNQSTFRWEF